MPYHFDPLEHETSTNDLEFLTGLAQRYARGGTAIEIGTWVGGSAIQLACHCEEVFCIDDFAGNKNDRLGAIANRVGRSKVFQTFCANINYLLFDHVHPCVGTSRMWASVWRRKAHLIFIDAEHNYDAVREDMMLWQPFVRPGGVLCGHDYSGHFPGVMKAVRELIPADKIKLGGDSIWYTVFER